MCGNQQRVLVVYCLLLGSFECILFKSVVESSQIAKYNFSLNVGNQMMELIHDVPIVVSFFFLSNLTC